MAGVRYVALSHCWGNDSNLLKLTTTSLNALCKGIEDILRTFQDAIAITKALKIDYLWIDSLCIIQYDSDHADHYQHDLDWQKHIGIMDCIYQSCAINVAAASGTDPSSGCFATRNPHKILPSFISVSAPEIVDHRYVRRRTPTTHMIIEQELYENIMACSIGRFHLDSRGWVAQERLLSPRTVHFSDQQIFWECTEVPLACESLPLGHLGHSILPSYGWRVESTGEEDQHKRWLKIVRDFTRRNLTQFDDRLPAIAGIAKRIQSVLKDDYFAGIFRATLPEALLWQNDITFNQFGYLKPSTKYRAPTWSWAHVDGPLIFHRYQTRDIATQSQIQVVCIKPVNPSNMFGQVKSGYIKIHGPFGTVSRKVVDLGADYKFDTENFQFVRHQLEFDQDPTTYTWTIATLLLIIGRFTEEHLRLLREECGLILIPNPQDIARFIRIGVFYTKNEGDNANLTPDWKGYTNFSDVTIV
jgi:hypothetical protein